MKKVWLLFYSLLTSTMYAQTLNWQWAQSAGSFGNDAATSMAIDNSGNIYMTGNTLSTSITFGTYTLSNPDSLFSIFLAKYDPSGNVLWALSNISPSAWDPVVCVDPAGSVYLAGRFSDTLTFGSVHLNAAVAGIFIVKFDSNGNALWGEVIEGQFYNNECYDIGADGSGNIYVAGSYANQTWFGNIMLNSTNINYFLAKYDSSGNVIWVTPGVMPSHNSYYQLDISVEQNGNVFMTGSKSTISLTFGNIVFNYNQGYNGFLVKFDSSGNAIWGNSTPYAQFKPSVASDPDGNVYISGCFRDTAVFGTTFLYSMGEWDPYIAKYDSGGVFQWAESEKASSSDISTAITTGPGIILHAGTYRDTLYVGNIQLLPVEYRNMYIAVYDFFGNVLGATAVGETYSIQCSDAIADNAGGFYLSGYFNGGIPYVTFGNDTLINSGFTSFSDVFIARLNFTTMIPETEYPVPILFPNPNNGRFTISIPAESQSKEGQIEIYSISGKFIYSTSFLNQSHQLDLDLGEGIYLLKIFSEKETAISRFVVAGKH